MSFESDILGLAAFSPSTPNNIGVYRLHKPPWTFGLEGDRMIASAAWHVPAGVIDGALDVVGGQPETFTLPGGVTITRIVPLRHPTKTDLIAEWVHAEGKGQYGDFYRFFELQVRFASPQFDLGGAEPFMTFAGSASGRTMAAPASALQFGDGSHPAGDLGMVIPGADFTVTLHKVPTFDPLKYIPFVRYVNSVPFRGFPAGTVQFAGVNWTQQTTIGNVTTWQIGLGFRATSPDRTWNQEVRRDGSVANVYLGGTTTPRYPAMDLYALLA